MPIQEPPNYRVGTQEEHCSNCGAYEPTGKRYSGFCRMFSVRVTNAKVCDKWYARASRRLKLRGRK